MSVDVILLIGIIAFTLSAFVFEWLPIDVVALTSLALLLLFNLVTPQEAISGFSNPAVITVMMMFILSYCLTHTGLISKLGHRIASLSGTTYWVAAATLLVVCAVMSAFVSNTATLAILMPVGIQLAKHYRVSSSMILLPLSYASIIGGTCTLIGTSTNLLVGSLAESHGLEPVGVFEFLSLGSILLVIGLAYSVLAPLWLVKPRHEVSDLTGKYALGAFLTELKVQEGSRLLGRTVVQEQVSERYQLNVLEIVRDGQKIALDLRYTPLQTDDRLIVRGPMEAILAFKEQANLLLPTDVKLDDSALADDRNILAEVQLSPISRLTGQTIKEIDFRRRYGCFVLALNRTGEVIRDKLASITLRQWDTLLVFGPRTRVEALAELEDFVALEEVQLRLHLSRRWWIGAAIIPLVVILAAAGVMSILEASILGAVLVVVSGVITIQQAYESVNWTVIFLLAAILPLGIAMENTGLAAMIGQGLADLSVDSSPLVAISLVYLTTAILSEVVSNNSTAVLMVPISLTTAALLGYDARPFVMAVAFGASASFLTPMGYQTNAMVFGPGGYRFVDYLRLGFPIKVVFWLVSVLLIPVIWPLQ